MINEPDSALNGQGFNQLESLENKVLVESMVEATWITDASGRSLQDAPAWRAYTGQTLKKWMEEGWTESVHPDDKDGVIARWQAALQSKQMSNFVCRLRQAADDWCWNDVRVAPIPGLNGETVKWVGACVDISQQKQAEANFTQSETQFRLLAMLSSDTLYRMSADWRVMVNLRGFDFLADTVVTNGQWFEQYIPTSDQERVRAAIDEAIINKSLFELEHQVYRADGSIGWTSSRATPLLDNQGQVKEWFGTARDITKRKMAEERRVFLLELSDKLRPLASSLEIQKTAASLIGAKLNTDRVIYAEIIGAEDEYLIARNYLASEEVIPVIGNFPAAPFGKWLMDEAKAGNTVVINDVVTDQRLTNIERDAFCKIGVRAFITTPLKKEGKWVAAMKIHHGQARNWTDLEISLVGEIAERTWAAVQRAKAEEALLDADRRKDEFLALLAHELRNPMATLSNTLMVLEMTGGMNHKLPLDKAITMMRKEVVQLVRLVDDLLDVSRINQGKVTLELERLDFAALVNDAVLTALPIANSENRHLTTALPDEPMYVNGDRARLTQVVRNLLSNAIKFTNEDGHIWVELTKEHGYAVLKVRDDGIGIPSDQLDRIFELFVQVNSSRTRLRDGLGLGLTLVKDFVEKHGGRIQVHSAGLDTGSEFIIYLPVIPPL